MNIAPIILFTYNRPWHTEQTLEALSVNKLANESILYIYCDGPKQNASTEQKNKIKEVREVIRKKQWCKEIHIIEAEENRGLANSIIAGVTEVIDKYGKVIVLEDDLVTSQYFLKFMNETLFFYEKDTRIFSIGATNYIFPIPINYNDDVYLVHRTESCGWGTWKDRWQKAEWNLTNYDDVLLNKREKKKFNRGGNDLSVLLNLQLEKKIDSWAIQWDYCHYKYDAYCLRPIKSFVNNIGFDGSGIHSDNNLTSGYTFSGVQYDKDKYEIKLIENIKGDKKIERNLKTSLSTEINIFVKLFKKGRRILKKIRKKIRLKKFSISLSSVEPASQIFGLDRGIPIDRYYIEDFLNIHSDDIKGRALEIAESTYSRKFGKNAREFYVLHFDKSNTDATIVGDLSKPETLPENYCDTFICTQTLNFIYNVKEAILGCHKLLTKNGIFLGTVAGISQISRYDMERWGDYWRFTDLSVKKMFEEIFGVGNVEVKIYGNAMSATAFIQGLSVEDIPNKKKLMVRDENYQVIIGIRAVKC